MSFDLAYNGKNNTAWNALFAQQGWTRPVVVTIAVDDGRPLPLKNPGANFQLVVIRRRFAAVGGAQQRR